MYTYTYRKTYIQQLVTCVVARCLTLGYIRFAAGVLYNKSLHPCHPSGPINIRMTRVHVYTLFRSIYEHQVLRSDGKDFKTRINVIYTGTHCYFTWIFGLRFY